MRCENCQYSPDVTGNYEDCSAQDWETWCNDGREEEEKVFLYAALPKNNK